MASRRVRYRISVCFVLSLALTVQCNDSCNADFEKILDQIFSPQERPTMQTLALRRYVLRLLETMTARAEELEGWNGRANKRNLEALARAGYLHTLPVDDEDNQTESHNKRSLSSLVRTGQLPLHHYPLEEEGTKRSAEALSQSDRLNAELQRMLEDLYAKRNIASIAREGSFDGKRNAYYKNQIGTQSAEDKRNIASIKAAYKHPYKRAITKRQVDYYRSGDDEDYPLYQLAAAASEDENLADQLLQQEKRFLGRLPQMGKTKTTISPKTQFH